jgi:hypothetical protein
MAASVPGRVGWVNVMKESNEDNHFGISPSSVICGFHCHIRINQPQRNVTHVYTWVSASFCRHQDPGQIIETHGLDLHCARSQELEDDSEKVSLDANAPGRAYLRFLVYCFSPPFPVTSSRAPPPALMGQSFFPPRTGPPFIHSPNCLISTPKMEETDSSETVVTV